jgi:plasmid stability protein
LSPHAICMRDTHLSCRVEHMTSIQIRNVPDDVHRTLRARAAAGGQSLSEYLLEEIVRIVERPSVADLLARAGDRAGGTDIAEIVDAVRAGRDRT